MLRSPLTSLCLGLVLFAPLHAFSAQRTERGTLSIYFREQKVGYEEYVWTEDAEGYELSVTGRMTSPMPLEIESLTIRLGRDFIPRAFSFRGTINGAAQEVESVIREGTVTNTVRVGGRSMESTVSVRRDALLLPNPIFSPYIIAAGKFGCGERPPQEFAAYIIPQIEVVGQVEVKADNPCTLLLTLGGVEIALNTDESGRLKSILIPGQGIRVSAQDGP